MCANWRTPLLTPWSRVAASELPPNVGPPPVGTGSIRIPGSKMEDIERHAIMATLESTRGSTTKAAEVLGMSVRTIQYRLQQYHSAPKNEMHVPAIAPKRPD
jgi:two-component system response regulator HydG